MTIDIERLTDISEKGALIDGKPQRLDRRLFMQLLVFGNNRGSYMLVKALEEAGFGSVLYKCLNDRNSVALLTWNENPDFFVNELRHFIKEGPFTDLTLKEDYCMFGRTYSIGHEKHLEDWLIHRSPRVVANPEWKWAVWYPLRRTGAYALLDPKAQGAMLMEHGIIGRAFGEKDFGHDIRLACHGLDRNDNDFVIGLIGKDLYPLSMLVQTMRSTQQTSTYIEKMGPFFIGRAVWQSSKL